jgi:hypothetical protein
VEFDRSPSSATANGCIQVTCPNSEGVTTFDVQDNLVHKGTSTAWNNGAIVLAGISPTGLVANNLVYDFQTSSSTNVSYGIDCSIGWGGDTDCVNNTIHNIGCTNGSSNQNTFGVRLTNGGNTWTRSLQNNIITDTFNDGTGTVKDYSYTAHANTTEDYNLASDTTVVGSNSLTNKLSSTQFVTTTEGSEDLHLKTGADALEVGTPLTTLITTDAQGATRPGAAANRAWDIGALQGGATITKTIGTTGRNYSTITLFEADLDDTNEFSNRDDAVGECYNDSSFNEAALFDGTGSTVGLNSITVSVASGERHDGTAGTGANYSIDARKDPMKAQYSAVMDFTVEWLEFDCNDWNNQTHQDGMVELDISNGTSTGTARYLIVHDYKGVNGQTAGIGISANCDTNNDVYNNIIYKCITTTAGGGTQSWGIGSWQTEPANVYNNTVYRMEITNVSSGSNAAAIRLITASGRDVKNCIGMDTRNDGSGSGDDFQGLSASEMSYCCSSDTSAVGTGSLTSKVASNQFVSTTDGSEDLQIKDIDADIYLAGTDLGTTPTGVEIDIDGRNRDTLGVVWSIGAHQGNFVPPLIVPAIEKTLRRRARPIF